MSESDVRLKRAEIECSATKHSTSARLKKRAEVECLVAEGRKLTCS